MILTAELLKIGSRQTADGATITLKISAEDVLPHILLSAAPVGTVFVISYEIIEAGTQNGNLHIPRNVPSPDQDHDLPTLDIATNTSTSNEKDSPVAGIPSDLMVDNLCADTRFWVWAGVSSIDAAAKHIMNRCKVKSLWAENLFQEMIQEFELWNLKQVDVTPKLLKGGELAKWAGILCNDPEFWKWAGVNNTEMARTYILEECQITSRAELDHNKESGQSFRRMMYFFDQSKRAREIAENPDKYTVPVNDLPKHTSPNPWD